MFVVKSVMSEFIIKKRIILFVVKSVMGEFIIKKRIILFVEKKIKKSNERKTLIKFQSFYPAAVVSG